jgi:hypothetical protein
MKPMTKLFALGALGALGLVAAVAVKRRRDARRQGLQEIDIEELDEPVIVSEEVIVVTDAGPYAVDMEIER